MTNSLIALVLVIVGGLSLVKPLGWARRRLGGRSIPSDEIVRSAHAVGLRVLLFRTRNFLSMRPGKPHPAKADLLLTADRFLIASDRGVLADLRPDQGRRFSSVRCTGPGRLVIEGAIPPQGLYRFEIAIQDASDWVDALAPFVDPQANNAGFGSFRSEPADS